MCRCRDNLSLSLSLCAKDDGTQPHAFLQVYMLYIPSPSRSTQNEHYTQSHYYSELWNRFSFQRSSSSPSSSATTIASKLCEKRNDPPSCAHTPSHLWNPGGRVACRNAGHLCHGIPPGERCRPLRRTLQLPSPPKSNRDPVERPNSRSVAVSMLRRLKRPWRSIATPSAGNTCRKPRQ